METFYQRENVLLGSSPQRSFELPKTALRSSDVDFQDVFGGPPRRSSIYEMRYGFGEAFNSPSEEDVVVSRNPWSGLGEKPVFGGESINRRGYPSDDFFDDIFKGEESYSSPTPRRTDHLYPFSSTPGSRVLSPARPLPPKAEPFGTSLPAQFSLPAKLTKATDLTAFASSNRSPSRYKDGTSNGTSHSYAPNTPLSRFSRNDVRPSNCKSPLSHELFDGNNESSPITKSNETDVGANLRRELKSKETPCNNSQFHFSIYKWAGRGVPLLMPLRGVNSSKLKEMSRTERCSSSNGRIECDTVVSKLPPGNLQDIDSLFLNHTISSSAEPLKMEHGRQDKTITGNKLEPCQIVKEAVLHIPELKSPRSVQCNIEKVTGGDSLRDKREDTKSQSLPDIGVPKKHLPEETKREISVVTQEACKPELKPLRSLFNDEIKGQGNDEITSKSEGKEIGVKMTRVSRSNSGACKNAKQHDGKTINSNRAEVNKASLQRSPMNLGDNFGRSGVKGKVKEFVKIFNQEASSKPKTSVGNRSQSPGWRGRTKSNGADNEASTKTIGMDKIMQPPDVNKMPDSSFVVHKSLEQSEKQHSYIKTTIHKTSDNSSSQKHASSFSDLLPDGSKVILGDIDDPFQGNFLIKELLHDQDKLLQTGDDSEAIQVSDAKIRQWSNGKKGNIRSLLSTLQYVLWPDSGWKPVPLVDIIEGSAVKRAYQKALLCLHPDKLQQKGAASHQKYTAEKVFDILQEAWDHFNSLGSL